MSNYRILKDDNNIYYIQKKHLWCIWLTQRNYSGYGDMVFRSIEDARRTMEEWQRYDDRDKEYNTRSKVRRVVK